MISAHDLVGAWHLQSWTISSGASESRSHPFGESARGLLVYTEDRAMSAAIMRADRHGHEGAPRSWSDVVKAAAFDSYFAYAGAWSVEGDYVMHTVHVAANPALVGTVQRRHAVLAERDGHLHTRTLTLSAREDTVRGERSHVLVWQRGLA